MAGLKDCHYAGGCDLVASPDIGISLWRGDVLVVPCRPRLDQRPRRMNDDEVPFAAMRHGPAGERVRRMSPPAPGPNTHIQKLWEDGDHLLVRRSNNDASADMSSTLAGCGANAGDRRKKALGSLTRITRQALHSKSQARFCF